MDKEENIINNLAFKTQVAVITINSTENNINYQKFIQNLSQHVNCREYKYDRYFNSIKFLNIQQPLYEQNQTLYTKQIFVNTYDIKMKNMIIEQQKLDQSVKMLISSEYKEDIYQQWKMLSQYTQQTQYSQAQLNTTNVFQKQFQKLNQDNLMENIDSLLSEVTLGQIFNDMTIFKALILVLQKQDLDQEQIQFDIINKFIKFQSQHVNPLSCYCYICDNIENIDEKVLEQKQIYIDQQLLIAKLTQYVNQYLLNQILLSQQCLQNNQYSQQYIQQNLLNYSDTIYAINRYARTSIKYMPFIYGNVEIEHIIYSIIPYDSKQQTQEHSRIVTTTNNYQGFINFNQRENPIIPQLRIITQNQIIGKIHFLIACNQLKLRLYQEAIQNITQSYQRFEYENVLMKSILLRQINQQQADQYLLDIQDILVLVQHGFLIDSLDLLIDYRQYIAYQQRVDIIQNISIAFQILNFIQDRQIKLKFSQRLFQISGINVPQFKGDLSILDQVLSKKKKQIPARVIMMDNTYKFYNQGVRGYIEPQLIYSQEIIQKLIDKEINQFEFQQFGQKDIIYANQLQKIRLSFGWKQPVNNQLEILQFITSQDEHLQIQIISQQLDIQSCSIIVTVNFKCNQQVKYQNVQLQKLILKENNKIYELDIYDNSFLLLNDYCILTAQRYFDQRQTELEFYTNYLFKLDPLYFNCDNFKVIPSDQFQEYQSECILNINQDDIYQTQNNQIEIKYSYDNYQQMKLVLQFDENKEQQINQILASNTRFITNIQDIIKNNFYDIEHETSHSSVIQINKGLQKYLNQNLLKIKLIELTDNIKTILITQYSNFKLEKDNQEEAVLILQVYTNYNQLLNQYEISF